MLGGTVVPDGYLVGNLCFQAVVYMVVYKRQKLFFRPKNFSSPC